MGRGSGRQTSAATATRRAARSACVAFLVTASVSGTLVALGLPFYIFAALACAGALRRTFAVPASIRGGPSAVRSVPEVPASTSRDAPP